MATELIGWVAAVLLVVTLGSQVYKQWRDHTSRGLSKWLFIGQMATSVGFVIYSWLLGNWVFVTTNALLLVTAIIGQCLYVANKRQAERRPNISHQAAMAGDER